MRKGLRVINMVAVIKKIFLISIFLLFLPVVYAHCPLCTGAVGAAAVTANYYGVDISIIGLLIGAFGVSTGLWVGKKIKNIIRFQLPLIVLLSFVLTLVPLLYISNESIYLPVFLFGKSGGLFNKVYWINKLVFGGVIGGLISIIGYWSHSYIKRINNGVLFPYQGIVITIFLLAVSSAVLYYLI